MPGTSGVTSIEIHRPEPARPEVATAGPGAGAVAAVMVFSLQLAATPLTREPTVVAAVA